jgi:hypothetical protein
MQNTRPDPGLFYRINQNTIEGMAIIGGQDTDVWL